MSRSLPTAIVDRLQLDRETEPAIRGLLLDATRESLRRLDELGKALGDE